MMSELSELERAGALILLLIVSGAAAFGLSYVLYKVLDWRKADSPIEAMVRRRKNLCKKIGHDWRHIAPPYARQCRRPECGHVEFSEGWMPEGLKTYIEEQTCPRVDIVIDFSRCTFSYFVGSAAMRCRLEAEHRGEHQMERDNETGGS